MYNLRNNWKYTQYLCTNTAYNLPVFIYENSDKQVFTTLFSFYLMTCMYTYYKFCWVLLLTKMWTHGVLPKRFFMSCTSNSLGLRIVPAKRYFISLIAVIPPIRLTIRFYNVVHCTWSFPRSQTSHFSHIV